MSHNVPLVSVIILTYNQELFVKQSIQSVIDQKLTLEFEIIIGDDFSTDNTRNIIDKFKEDYPDRITIYYPNYNTGLLANFNHCIHLCSGKYLAVCAGDDFWHNNFKLQKQIDYLSNHPDFGVVHSDADYLFHPSGKLIRSYRKSTRKMIESGFIFENLLLDNFIIAATACIRLDLIYQYIDFSEYEDLGFLMEDYPMWLELSNRSKIGFLDESLATYRIHQKSIRNTENTNRLLEFLNSTYKIKNHFIDKFGCSYEVKRRVNKRYYRKMLFYSNVLRNRSLAKISFERLYLESEKIRIAEYLYFWSSQVKILNSITSFVLRKLHLVK